MKNPCDAKASWHLKVGNGILNHGSYFEADKITTKPWSVLPEVRIQGCVFHWAQALWRKVSEPETAWFQWFTCMSLQNQTIEMTQNTNSLLRWKIVIWQMNETKILAWISGTSHKFYFSLHWKVRELGLQVAYSADQETRTSENWWRCHFHPTKQSVQSMFLRLGMQAAADPLLDLVDYIKRLRLQVGASLVFEKYVWRIR